MRIIRGIRNIRQTYNVPASSEADVLIEVTNADELKCLNIGQDYIKRLARVNLQIDQKIQAPPMAAYEKVSHSTIYLPLAGLIDVEKSRTKLDQRKQALEKELAKITEVFSKPDFKARAPKEKVEAMQAQLTDIESQMSSVAAQLKVPEKA